MDASDAAGEIVAAHRALGAAGQADLAWGHAAARDPNGRGLWMKSAGWGLEEIDQRRIVLLTHDGEILAGDGPRHIEIHIHAALMRARSDVGAKVHTHSEAAAAFASLDVPLRPLSHEAVPFLAPDVPRFGRTGDLIRTAELGDALATAIGPTNGCLIPGHDLVTVGPDAPTAIMHAAMLDRACRIQLTAIAAGGPARWSSDAEVTNKRTNLWTRCSSRPDTSTCSGRRTRSTVHRAHSADGGRTPASLSSHPYTATLALQPCVETLRSIAKLPKFRLMSVDSHGSRPYSPQSFRIRRIDARDGQPRNPVRRSRRTVP